MKTDSSSNLLFPKLSTPFGKKLLVFDLDGTLIDSAHDLIYAINLILERHQFPKRSLEEIRRAVGNGAIKLLQRCIPDHTGVDFQQLYREFIDIYTAHATERTTLYPGVRELLERLDCHTALLTNKPEHPTRIILKEFGLEERFDAIIGGDTLATRKPDPEGLLYLAQKFSLSLDQLLMVGDASPDAEAAEAAGVDFLLIEGGFGKPEEMAPFSPRWKVAQFAEILPLAESLEQKR